MIDYDMLFRAKKSVYANASEVLPRQSIFQNIILSYDRYLR